MSPSRPHAPVTMRAAQASDAAVVAALAERTFRDAFAAQNTAADMDQFCAESYGEARQAAEIADPEVETWLAHDPAGTAVAFFQLRLGEAEEAPPGCSSFEVWRFYVDRSWHGRGVADAMMAQVFARARALGRDAVWLGVWEHNERAKAFYARCGFIAYGDHAFVLGTDHQRDVLMMAPVTA